MTTIPHAIREKIAADACARHIEPDYGAPASPDHEWIIGKWDLDTGAYLGRAKRHGSLLAFSDIYRDGAHAYASRRSLSAELLRSGIQYIAIRVRR